MFKRRHQIGFWRRVRNVLAPPTGYGRAARYLGHRVSRLPDTPHKIALGFACGVFASFSPFFGLHFFYAAFVAWVVRGNIVASLIGTAVGNPLTFPVMATASYQTGVWVLGWDEAMRGDGVLVAIARGFGAIWRAIKGTFGFGHADWTAVGDFLYSVYWPYLVGSFLPGALGMGLAYMLTVPLIRAYQSRRRRIRRRRSAGNEI